MASACTRMVLPCPVTSTIPHNTPTPMFQGCDLNHCCLSDGTQPSRGSSTLSPPHTNKHLYRQRMTLMAYACTHMVLHCPVTSANPTQHRAQRKDAKRQPPLPPYPLPLPPHPLPSHAPVPPANDVDVVCLHPHGLALPCDLRFDVCGVRVVGHGVDLHKVGHL